MVAKVLGVDIAIANTPESLAQVAAGKEALFSVHCCNRTDNDVIVKLGVSTVSDTFDDALMYWPGITIKAKGFSGQTKILLPAGWFIVCESSSLEVNFIANSVEE